MGKFRQKVKAAQSRREEETHLSRAVAKLSGKVGSLWAGGKLLIERSEDHEGLAFFYQSLPQPAFFCP